MYLKQIHRKIFTSFNKIKVINHKNTAQREKNNNKNKT